ncbi:MAG: hypothetical protein ACTSU5_11375 [Promethearchaeota archaeon]
MGIVEEVIDHLREMSETLADEFCERKIDKEFKASDGSAVATFKTDKKGYVEWVGLRLLVGKKDKLGDVVDELWVKSGGKKALVKRFFAKRDHAGDNLKKFHKADWKHYKEAKKYTIKEYVQKLEGGGFWFPGEKLSSKKALKKLLEEAATRLVELSSISPNPSWVKREVPGGDVDEEGGKKKADKGKVKEKGKDKEKGKVGGKGGAKDKDGGGKGAGDSGAGPSTLATVAKKIAITAATTVVVAAATPVGGAVIAGGVKAIQGADAAVKLGNAAIQSVKAAARPLEIVQKVAKEAVTQAGKKVLPGSG